MVKPRTYPVPRSLRASFTADSTTLDEMEHVSTRGGEAGSWALKVLARENDRAISSIIGDDTVLPRGVIVPQPPDSGDEIVTSLVNIDGDIWAGDEKGWHAPSDSVGETVLLEPGDVGFIVRAFREGAEAVVLSSAMPLAFISAAAPATEAPPEEPETETAQTGGQELPADAIPLAVVDSYDKDAVLELLAIAPGPIIFRRHAGSWHQDPAWVDILKAVTPPPIVKLEQEQVAAVQAQVDQSTEQKPFQEMAQGQGNKFKNVAASAYVQSLQNKADEQAIRVNTALLAVAGREVSPKDFASTEKLRRYWLYGPGAAKIRWYTPGSWRRCYRHLVKYLGPKMTPGYCTNLSQRLGGHGVATHVGD